MRLKDFIEEWGISVNKFARKAGVAQSTMRALVMSDGTRDVALSVALKIERASNRIVTCEDLISEDLLHAAPAGIDKESDDSDE